MLALLLCAVLAEYYQPGVITQAPTTLFAHADRMYKEAPVNFMGQLLITLFRLGTPSLALCLCFCPSAHAPFSAFWAVCGCLLAVILAKMLCNVLLDYTFMLTRRFGAIYEAYANLATTGALLLYPALLVLLRVSDPLIAQWTVGGLAVLYIGTWTFRTIRTCVTSPGAFIYLILYIATLEVLPMSAFIYLSAQTIMIL